MKKNYQNPAADAWYRSLLDDCAQLPFSFVYGGVKYIGFPRKYFSEDSRRTEREGGSERTVLVYSFRDGIRATLVLRHCFDYGTTEWTVYFRNGSDRDSGVFENLQSQIEFEGELPVLKGILGDHVNRYRPYSLDLAGVSADYSSDSGRATHIHFPYFNLEYGSGGCMLAVGWAGTWNARFESDGQKTVCTLNSVNGLRTYLRPGEEIRTALFVMAPYAVRNEHYASNYWRSWYIAYNMPKADGTGTDIRPFSTCCLSDDTGLPNSDGSISERFTTWRPSLEKMIAEGVKVDFRWFDAGWYAAPDGSSPVSDWWGTVGTWELDPVKWPGGTFRESTDFAREHGMKTLMWFEPERVTDPESMVKNHGYKPEWAIVRENCAAISNNIGNDECRRWTTERICKVLCENRVEMYREDNNSDAAALWKYLDEKEGDDRRGITECKFIAGHYRMWDDIIACTLSYGGCGFVDSCASGGGRNDLESMRRGIPLLRSDHDRETTGIRLSMTTAFNKWIPACGAITKEKKHELAADGNSDPYIWRASYLPVLNVSSRFVQDPCGDFGMLRFGLKEWKKVSPWLLKDFYTLTPWRTEYDVTDFTAFCYFDPGEEKGILFAFRQEACVRELLNIALPFADGESRYLLTDEDSGEELRVCGGELKSGISLFFAAPHTARLLWVKAEK